MGIALLLIVACSPKDEEYYFKNLDIAVDKASSCDQALIKAATINDEKTLLKLKEEYCSAKGEYQICAVWKERWQKQNKRVVDRLMKDEALFMGRYNHCTTLVEEIRHSGKSWGERNSLEREIVNHYPCVQAAEAYRKRGLGWANFSTPVVLEKNVSK